MEHKHTVLIVDDEKELRDLISGELNLRGYHAITAVSGEECIERIKTVKVDILLLDIKLPGISGINVLEEVRKLNPEIEIIMITAHSSLEYAVETLKKGAADYIEKPIILNKLIASIEKALEQRSLKETVLLYEISKAIFSTIELEALLKIIVDLTMRVLKADDVSVMLFNEERQLYIAISSGLNEDIKKKIRLDVGERIAGWAAQHKEPLILINGLSNDNRFNGVNGRDEIKSAMVIPLLRDHEVIGVLNANRMKIGENFTQNDLYKAKIFISLVCLALDNANLYSKLKKAREILVIQNDELAQKEKICMASLAQIKKANEELTLAQKQLVHSEKLSSLGRLVSEMAHEVNNPLMIISGTAQLCLMERIENEEVKKNIAAILKECDAAKEIIQRLLKFSRFAKGELKEMAVDNCIDSILAIIEHQFSLSNVRITKKYARNIPRIYVDEKQIQEVLFNLLNNARDAMPGGGIIEIEVSQENDYVRIDVKDTGLGMPDDVKEKLFEPFFTTKEKGLGLGLSVCYGIIKSHQGKLEFKSQPKKGTTASMFLPIKRVNKDKGDGSIF